ncbi:hypothetical protein R6242_21540 [Iodobacter sp. CM08]|uniref:hypothetical protein n=1 Tax=Iodobacter sp. CM08 TaxID=3085902 RepID=UPI0029811A9E|nr:hypothetical protein [Iodobacter sp. CM08]MDW5419161.1 hypothetical protein [Iodobacter sp. CM08]
MTNVTATNNQTAQHRHMEAYGLLVAQANTSSSDLDFALLFEALDRSIVAMHELLLLTYGESNDIF